MNLEQATFTFYQRALAVLRESNVPFLICGSFALQIYTQIARHTKDLDVFVRRQDCSRALTALAAAGYATELVFSHWLGKAHCGQDFIDVIFCSGNGLCPVDDSWFEHALDAEAFGMAVQLCPPEEIIWQKAFIMERERFDGADIAHLIRAHGANLAWPRLLRRFDRHWRLLLVHLLLFHVIYPGETAVVPQGLIKELLARAQSETADDSPGERLCRGTILSRSQYLADIEHWGYRDARLPPHGAMTPEQIRRWTSP
jgi:hypothetical protein